MPKITAHEERDLLPLAMKGLEGVTGITGDIAWQQREGADTCIVLHTPDGREVARVLVEVKRGADNAVAARLATLKKPRLLVTDYVNPAQAERFRKLGLQFIDCAGNAFINTRGLYLFVKGNRQEPRPDARPARLLHPAGLQVLFALLCNPGLETASYREIATKAKVALGTVAGVLNALGRQGHLIELDGHNRRLVKKAALLELWLIGYERLLRPKLVVNTYHAEKRDWWREVDVEGALWGGEVAALKMTGYLKPERVTLYADKLPERLMLQHRLHIDPRGEVEVLTPFWGFDYPQQTEDLAPPVLVYADLMVQADGRTTEVARMIYDQHIARHITQA